MYRWKTVIGISELTAHFNSLIGSYLRKNGSVYILENGEPSDKVVNDIGNIASIKVIERGCGGVVAALMVERGKGNLYCQRRKCSKKPLWVIINVQ